MNQDIDNLLEAQDLDAILVTGPAQNNPAMVYLTGIAHLTNAYLIKKRSEPPVLFHAPMERDEARHTGLRTILLDIPYRDALLREHPDDLPRAYSLMYQRLFAEAGLEQGRVAVYGLAEAGSAYAILSALQKDLPQIEIVGELGKSVLLSAMETKSSDEIEQIRKIGQTATTVIGQVAELLNSHSVRQEVLVKPDGSPLTIGDVKQKIDMWLAGLGAENPEGTIFASGYDAGVPHSSGNADDPLRLGQTIVFDFFPRQAGGGYFYDITRTWCLGYATDEALALYEDVLHVYQSARGAYLLGTPYSYFQQLACELFEARGHPTQRSKPTTTEGYVHSLGHGVGLHVHELPWFRLNGQEDHRITPNVVFTVEPGLYYPQRGLGVRLEDTVWARPDGEFEVLAPFPLDLVLPMKR